MLHSYHVFLRFYFFFGGGGIKLFIQWFYKLISETYCMITIFKNVFWYTYLKSFSILSLLIFGIRNLLRATKVIVSTIQICTEKRIRFEMPQIKSANPEKAFFIKILQRQMRRPVIGNNSAEDTDRKSEWDSYQHNRISNN